MADILFMIAAFAAGGAAAAVCTHMLWTFVNEITTGKYSFISAAGGFAARIGICGVIFLASAYGGHFERVLACAAGFFVVRTVLINRLKQAAVQAVKNEH
jgi:hypothetical protein